MVDCRGLIYQALSQGNSYTGFDESNPYGRIDTFFLRAANFFAFFAAIFMPGEKRSLRRPKTFLKKGFWTSKNFCLARLSCWNSL